jgi:anti-sigma regulatory factor (Ser/Thr protein kinase)
VGKTRNRTATLTADAAAVDAACEAARDFAADAGLGDDTGARLCIIVEELVVNLVEHAGLAPPDQLVLDMAWDGRDVTMVLTDPGPPFDPRVAPPPGDLPPERGGGAGLAMVQAWAHIESYVRFGGINRLTLRLPGD